MSNDTNVEATIEMSNTDAAYNDMTVEQRLQVRKEAALLIDAETAVLRKSAVRVLDPYNEHPDLPPEYQTIGKEYFARSPGSGIWVLLEELPDEIRVKLWKRPEGTKRTDSSDDCDF